MQSEVKRYVKNRVVCQHNKTKGLSSAGLLQPLLIPSWIWEDISMDFVDGLPRSSGYFVILIVVDRLSRYAHFIPLSHPFTSKSVALLFIREIVRLYGLPLSIVSDCDKIFMNPFWTKLLCLQGTRLNRSTTFHPQTNGQTERANRFIEIYLSCFCGECPKTWNSWFS